MTSRDTGDPGPLVDHFFRHQAGRLVAVLTRSLGLAHLDLIEDTVQSALVEALEAWKIDGPPRDPSAWIYRVARNKALDTVRRQGTRDKYAPELQRLARSRSAEVDEPVLETEIRDSQLSMIFVCCSGALPGESHIALTLKTLCGLSTREIARALLFTEVNVKKRITRAKKRLRGGDVRFEVPYGKELPERLSLVHTVLYLLFNEGYYSSHPDTLIRRDLCDEAIRLGHLLLESPSCATPETQALLALMHLHAARFDARLDSAGGILLLAEQDRGLWNVRMIGRGLKLLAESARGGALSHYHLEAGIAAHHCAASSFEATDWRGILGLYDELLTLGPSPVLELNRAIVLAQIEGPAAGIAAIERAEQLSRLDGFHLRSAALGELYFRAGDMGRAAEHLRQALAATSSASEKRLLSQRLAVCARR